MSQVANHHYNERSLHVDSGIATREQLTASVHAVFKQIKAAYPGEGYETATFRVNVVTDTRGTYFGYSYVWVSDKRIFHMLIGNNPDGSERYEYFVDPSWKLPAGQAVTEAIFSEVSTRHDEKLKAIRRRIAGCESAVKSYEGSTSWADAAEAEDAELEMEGLAKDLEEYTGRLEAIRNMKASDPHVLSSLNPENFDEEWSWFFKDHMDRFKDFIAPKLRHKADPIVTLVPYKYTADQKRALAEKIKEEAVSKGEGFHPSDVPDIGYFDVTAAHVSDAKPGDSPNLLCCRNAPSWVTEEMVREYFDCFNTDPNIYWKIVNKKEGGYRFPIYTLHEKRDKEGNPIKMIYVTFSEKTRDAGFALHFTRKFTITHPTSTTKSGHRLEAMLIFGPWREEPSAGKGGLSKHYKDDRPVYKNVAPPPSSTFNRPPSRSSASDSAPPRHHQPPVTIAGLSSPPKPVWGRAPSSATNTSAPPRSTAPPAPVPTINAWSRAPTASNSAPVATPSTSAPPRVVAPVISGMGGGVSREAQFSKPPSTTTTARTSRPQNREAAFATPTPSTSQAKNIYDVLGDD